MDRVAATVLAETISGACVDAMLKWGEAVNDAEAHPDDEFRRKIAQAAGLECCRLAAGIAAKLRPTKG